MGYQYWLLILASMVLTVPRAIALPPPEDPPEEVLRTEIITEARSPVNGQPLDAAEYAQLQADLAEVPPPRLDSQVRHTIFQLQILNLIRKIIP